MVGQGPKGGSRVEKERGIVPLVGCQFTQEIQDKPISTSLRLPTLEAYDVSTDSVENVVAFPAQMTLYGLSNALMCRAFSTTLRGPARMWYSRLKSHLVSSFCQLTKESESNFLASDKPKLSAIALLELSQKDNKPFSIFVSPFTTEIKGLASADRLLVCPSPKEHDNVWLYTSTRTH
ncbi:hypothetical protein B296_00047562 [Ensete ventricosum]|uniref:Retrotransposon gag domain-containing protein n=1 Tax=Ensete ventricosum TaxID=4639 RepID=A0A426XC79_ENSVE|nr:hypothetical protein B296_00047562 [Ensete ventricosum]